MIKRSILIITGVLLIGTSLFGACDDRLFDIRANKGTTIAEVVDQLTQQCDLTLIVKDNAAYRRLRTQLDRLSLKDRSLPEILNVILGNFNINYTLEENILTISYLMTKTFHVDYIGSERNSVSNTHVSLSDAASATQATNTNTDQTQSASLSSGAVSQSNCGINITSENRFAFWEKLGDQIESILNRPEDSYQAGRPVIDKEAGLVTITGTKKQLDRVQNYLEEVSRRLHQQVLIDVKMYAVILSKGKETGINWKELYKLQHFKISSERFKTNDNVGEITFPSNGELPYISKVIGNLVKYTDIVMYSELDTIIKFLKDQGDVHSVSNPKVLTLNNQSALITVGKQYFYKIKNAQTLAGTGTGSQTTNEIISSVFAGILLDITPEIAADGTITLKINPSVSDTITPMDSTSNANRQMPPDLERRQMSSVVTVKDGAHIVLGGLITDKSQKTSSKVPILGDIPILGHLFNYRNNIHEKIELVIIVTPHLVKHRSHITLKDLGYKRLTDRSVNQ